MFQLFKWSLILGELLKLQVIYRNKIKLMFKQFLKIKKNKYQSLTISIINSGASSVEISTKVFPARSSILLECLKFKRPA